MISHNSTSTERAADPPASIAVAFSQLVGGEGSLLALCSAPFLFCATFVSAG